MIAGLYRDITFIVYIHHNDIFCVCLIYANKALKTRRIALHMILITLKRQLSYQSPSAFMHTRVTFYTGGTSQTHFLPCIRIYDYISYVQ